MTNYKFSPEDVTEVLLKFSTPSPAIIPEPDNNQALLFNVLLNSGKIIPVGNMFYLSSPTIALFINSGQLAAAFLSDLRSRSAALYNEVLHIINGTAAGKLLVSTFDSYETEVKNIRSGVEVMANLRVPDEIINEYVQPRLTELAASFNGTYIGILRGIPVYNPPSNPDVTPEPAQPTDPEDDLSGAIGVLVEDIEALG